MTAESIAAAKGAGYARYLESKTLAPEPGAYYLTPEGEPTQPAGRWLASQETLTRLGLDGDAIDGPDFIALMEGRHPRTEDWLRAEGAGGGRGGGIDVTFSAPKSVSVEWALADEKLRASLEQAHTSAVEQALTYIRSTVPIVRRRRDGHVVEECARDLLAAEYRHTTARSAVPGDMPDPQLHSHVVITAAVREDDMFVAVASRPVFRAARDAGAYYRSALAQQLIQRGYAIEAGTGKHGRYFEIAGYTRGLLEAFSTRSREVAAAAERFRARWGRAPERGELRQLKRENRLRKVLVHRGDLDRAWQQTAAGHDDAQLPPDLASERRDPLAHRVQECLTERAAIFEPRELRAAALEQSVGEIAPEQALAKARGMIHERRVLRLRGGLMTTRAVRERELAIERDFRVLAQAVAHDTGDVAREIAAEQVAERIGASLGLEQTNALAVLTGPSRAAVLIGPAGTGKGVVIDAAAKAEQLAGRQTFGIAVSGSTAQRLGHDSPTLAGYTLTLDAFVRRVEVGALDIQPETTVFIDEAGMADTRRLRELLDAIKPCQTKLILIGDSAQLPSIGPGGMFARLTALAPTAELSVVRRTPDPAEQRAWADLRAGRSDRAMAHYQSTGRLHMTDTRDEALEQAVQAWAELTESHSVEEVALISDASNQEINRLNARAQHMRAQRGELGALEVAVPGVHYGLRTGDRIATIEQHHQRGELRVENGSQGEVVDVTPFGKVTVQFDVTGRRRSLADEELAKLRLGYAQHIHRAQGATVQRTLVVTGGWQTSKEPAYVEASRARHGTDWYVNREQLGTEGQDAQRIESLAALMRVSRAQTVVSVEVV